MGRFSAWQDAGKRVGGGEEQACLLKETAERRGYSASLGRQTDLGGAYRNSARRLPLSIGDASLWKWSAAPTTLPRGTANA